VQFDYVTPDEPETFKVKESSLRYVTTAKLFKIINSSAVRSNLVCECVRLWRRGKMEFHLPWNPRWGLPPKYYIFKSL